MNCPVCTEPGEERFVVDGFRILGCAGCSHEFLDFEADASHVDRVYGDSYFEGGGAGYSDYLAERDLLRKRGQFYAKKLAALEEPGHMLDVGAGAGCLLKGFVDQGWTGEGLEPNAKMVTFGREELDLTMHRGSLEDFESGERYDLVSMIQVIAHFYDQQAIWDRVDSLLKPGGMVLVETWDRDSLAARVLRKRWHEYSPPSVLNWFSRTSLRRIAERHGFDCVAMKQTLKKISISHAASLMEHKAGQGLRAKLFAALKKTPDWASVIYPADDLFWAAFKKSA